MDINEFIFFNKELNKNASFGRVLKKIFMAKNTPLKERAASSVKSLANTATISGTLGVGGLAYGGIKQPASLMNSAPLRFKY